MAAFAGIVFLKISYGSEEEIGRTQYFRGGKSVFLNNVLCSRVEWKRLSALEGDGRMTVRVGLRIPWIFFENTGSSPFPNEEKRVQFDEEEERLRVREATSMKRGIY